LESIKIERAENHQDKQNKLSWEKQICVFHHIQNIYLIIKWQEVRLIGRRGPKDRVKHEQISYLNEVNMCRMLKEFPKFNKWMKTIEQKWKWWPMPEILALRRMKPEDNKVEINLSKIINQTNKQWKINT
jgi:hypothetical protein